MERVWSPQVIWMQLSNYAARCLKQFFKASTKLVNILQKYLRSKNTAASDFLLWPLQVLAVGYVGTSVAYSFIGDPVLQRLIAFS